MWKLGGKTSRKVGLVVTCIGIGIVLTVVVPMWGWIGAVGIGLIYWGWQVMNHNHH
ncbi:MAG: hypothetical protein Q8930_18800 [Bacillota bacterium]|nr:hypothetical protein [Bacillota bacterium]